MQKEAKNAENTQKNVEGKMELSLSDNIARQRAQCSKINVHMCLQTI